MSDFHLLSVLNSLTAILSQLRNGTKPVVYSDHS